MECNNNNVTGQFQGATIKGAVNNDMEKYIIELNKVIDSLSSNLKLTEKDLEEKIEIIAMLEGYVLELAVDKAEATKEMGLRLFDICKKYSGK